MRNGLGARVSTYVCCSLWHVVRLVKGQKIDLFGARGLFDLRNAHVHKALVTGLAVCVDLRRVLGTNNFFCTIIGSNMGLSLQLLHHRNKHDLSADKATAGTVYRKLRLYRSNALHRSAYVEITFMVVEDSEI